MTFRSCLTVLLFMSGVLALQPVCADEFSRAKKLLKEGKSKQAYEFLVNEEGYHMGEADYDFLLARIALAAGFTHEAIFAFERVLIHSPNNLQARIEMAVAYYRINELENAKRHLNIVLAAKPEGDLNKTLQQYLELINEKIASRKNEFTGSHSFRQGWDSNINSATNESEIKLKIGNYRPTDGVDKETSDTFSELVNRLNYEHHLNVNKSFYGSAGYTIRENNTEEFDTQAIDLKLGYAQNTELGKFSVPIGYQTTWMDEKQLRYATSIGASLSHDNKSLYSSYTVQYGEIRYPGSPALNVDHVVLSYGLAKPSSSAFNQQYGLFYGDETAKDSRYSFNARIYKGFQVRLPVKLTPHQQIIPRLVYQRASYKRQHPFFFTTREDKHLNFSTDWNWYLDRKWQINGQISHARNSSTVSLYEYERNMVYLGITYKY